MAQLSELYNAKIMALAAAIPSAVRLGQPDATATAHSKLCGSTIHVDLVVRDGLVAAYGQSVKACLLGQASASVMGREIIGSSPEELRDVGARMRDMLKGTGPAPTGRWADLAVLEPVREVKARHASTLLVFEAVEKALATIEQAAPAPAS
jgi:NifU-like protein involved in Fe-S cluster formation